jgi:hypothetical protein
MLILDTNGNKVSGAKISMYEENPEMDVMGSFDEDGDAIEKLVCFDFFFYSDGQYRTVSKWNSKLLTFDNDLKSDGAKLRIFGTEKQVDQALDEYIAETGLNLDESFSFKVEPKGSYYYDLGIITDKHNKDTEARLKVYTTLYKQEGSKVLKMSLIG